ncbi:hypothetical protein Tco_0895113, partial [Tanacetum coccineum]
KTCNNDKNLSENQLEHEKEDELVAVVGKVVHECRHWIVDYMMVVKEIENELLEEVEKLEWWFEQDIDDKGEEDEEYGGTDIQKKDKNEAKTDKTEHGIGKGAKSQSQSQKVKVKNSKPR